MSDSASAGIERLRPELLSLWHLYARAKGYVIGLEGFVAERGLPTTATYELRNAFDHLMSVVRVLLDAEGAAVVVEGSGLDAESYCQANLAKATGHICRAAFDALDIISLRMLEEILAILEVAPAQARAQAVQDYATLERQLRDAATARATNGVGDLDSLLPALDSYERAMVDLDAVLSALRDHADLLCRLGAEHRRHSRRAWWVVVVAVASFVLGVVVTLLAH